MSNTSSIAVTISALSNVPVLESLSDWPKFNGTIQLALDMVFGAQWCRLKPTQGANKDANTYYQRLKRWQDNQIKAVRAIRTKLSQNADELAKDFNVERDPPDTVKTLIERLELRFRPAGNARLKEYKADIKSLGQPDELKILEALFLYLFLNNLGETYQTFLTAFFQGNSLLKTKTADSVETAAVTFDKALVAAEQEEQNQKLQNLSNKTAFLVAILQSTDQARKDMKNKKGLKEKASDNSDSTSSSNKEEGKEHA
ncbi:hypothetical protein F5Y14DRAFT_445893 [Nemania sp. NC0429]|nr:hypothetical protein F5Y14DRAFT_445893 [Nemania sp. NC0429]